MSKTKSEGKFSEEEMEEMILNRVGEVTGNEKAPSFLTERQMEDLEHYIEDRWGSGEEDGHVFHEMSSAFVHTDVMALGKEGENKTFATFGMSAREMPVPEAARPYFDTRIELVMRASPDLEIGADAKDPRAGMIVASELVNVSKYPFWRNSWLGSLHTLNASDDFREKFGYEFFLFVPFGEVEPKGLGHVTYLLMIPVYEEERNWMASHPDGSERFLEADLDTLDDDECDLAWIDRPRDVILPED